MPLIESKVTQDARVARYILYFVVAFAILYFFGTHEGVYYSDDIGYSEFAGRLLNGTFDITQNGHTFIHRPTVYIPVAILYALFGVNFITYTLWPFLCTLGCLIIVFKSAHQHALNPAFAVVLLGFTFYFIYFSNFLYPDNIVAFFTLAAASVFFRIYNGNTSRLLLQAAVATCCLFLAGLAKETAIVFLPFLAVIALRDIRRRVKNLNFWAYCALIGAVLLALYFGWYFVETEDPFYRLSEMEKANLSYDNFVTNGSRTYLKRLFWGPLEALVGTGTFILLVFAFGGKSLLSEKDRRGKLFWFLLFLSSYLVLSFSSTSLKVYNPITLDARMYNLVIPPLAIAASYGLQKKLTNIKFTVAYTLIFTLIALYLNNKVGAVYGLLALYFALHTLWLNRGINLRKLPYLALAAIALALAIRPTYFILKDKTLFYPEHKQAIRMLQQKATSVRKPLVVVVPDYLYHSRNYFLAYKPSDSISFIPYSGADSTVIQTVTLLLFNHNLNHNPSFHQPGDYEHILEAAAQKRLHWKNGPLALYEL